MQIRHCLFRFSSKPCLLALFMLCALPTGLGMALLTPLGQVPDEPAHVIRVAGLLHGIVLAMRRPAPQSSSSRLLMYDGVKINAGLLAAAFGKTSPVGARPDVLTADDLQATRKIPWTREQVFADIPNTTAYFPAFYLPAAAGLMAARLAHLSPYHSLLLARLSMLAAFLLVGTAALWLAPFGEALLLAVLLLPMALFLAGSINQDGMLIAAACLAAARLANGRAAPPTTVGLGFACFILILLAKLPYLPLLGLLLLPFGAACLPKRLALVALAATPVLLWAVLLLAYSIVPFQTAPYHPGPLWAGDRGVLFDRTDAGANLHVLLADPVRFLTLPGLYVMTNGIQKLRETVGVLGWLNLQFSDAYYCAWLAGLFMALLGLLPSLRAIAQVGRLWLRSFYVLVVLLVTAWALTIAIYLSWTDVGAAAIEGVQGRYLIPLLPFLLLLRTGLPGSAALPAIVPALPVLAVGLFDLAYLPQQLVYFFYLH